MRIAFDNSYARLPEQFYSALPPSAVSKPQLIRINQELAAQLGLDPHWLASSEGVEVLAGNRVPEGAEPIATVYAGHQFGSWNPQLGDGRAILLGELCDSRGDRYDVQLKGSGRTPYSRGGDGRSPLGPVLREYIVSEAMAALGIPTSRALAAVATGETVVREEMLPGAVLTRIASSHIRIGTMQYFASRGDRDSLQILVDYTLKRHYPDRAAEEPAALALLESVIQAQAELVARWQLVGFIHGVMNTDNMLLSGETIDYGPCAFMDSFDPETVYSSIDHAGRYAYRNQPGIAHWNLAALAQSLIPLLGDDQEAAVASAQAAVDKFPDLFLEAHQRGMAPKLGLQQWREEDEQLARDWLEQLAAREADFTLAFRALADLADSDSGSRTVAELFQFDEAFDPWLQRWRARCELEDSSPADRQAMMYTANPVFIPRNHQVEAAIQAATYEGNLQPFQQLVERLARPFDYEPADREYALPPQPEQVVQNTFCGT